MNITELARRLKIPTQQLKDELPKLGFDIGRRAIKIDDAVAEKVVKLWTERQRERHASQYVIVEHKLDQVVAPDRSAREVLLPAFLTPREFAALLGLPVTTVVGELFKNGVMASINERIDFETASIIAQDLGFSTKAAVASEQIEAAEQVEAANLATFLIETDETKLKSRPPVVVVMGHVDHGKTTLLDTIRSTNVAGGESGAITQHIGAYQVTTEKGRAITFLDTPGHEAFSAMRSRGGRLADVAIIVVAADDGLQPQTLEAIEIVQREKLALLIAINKIDKENADIERVKKALAELNLLPEDWGGKTICVPISAKKQKGIAELLDMVLLLADIEKLQANPDRLAAGTIIEAHLDAGEGPVATALVQAGTLHVGDYLIAGNVVGKVRAMKDFKGISLKLATPSTPVRVLGLRQVPQAGDMFRVAKDDAEVREALRRAPKYQRRSQHEAMQKPATTSESAEAVGVHVHLNVILKTDVLGSREAIMTSLVTLTVADAGVRVIRAGLGSITEHDIIDAEASHAVVFGFNVPVQPAAESRAKTSSVVAQSYKVIYDLLDEAKKQISLLLKPELVRSQIGELKVLQVFRRGKQDMIVGCRVMKGLVRSNTHVRAFRGTTGLADLELKEVRIGREVVGEVAEGGECGVSVRGVPVLDVGDLLEVYHEEIKNRAIS